MTWLKIDDGFAEHPKMDGLSDRSFRLHVAALCYSARNLTDGLLSPKAIRVLAAIVNATRINRNLDELVDAQIWIDNGDGSYSIYAYLEHNPPAEEVKKKRAEISEKRRDAGRKGAEARWNKPSGMANAMASADSNTDDTVVMAPDPDPDPSHPNIDPVQFATPDEPELSWTIEDEARKIEERLARQAAVETPSAQLLEALDSVDEGTPAVIRAFLADLPAYAVPVVLHELAHPSTEIRSRTRYAVGLLKRMCDPGSAQGRKLHAFGRVLQREMEAAA